jgi:histidinol-phosphate aminotransferase
VLPWPFGFPLTCPLPMSSTTNRINRFVRAPLRALSAYHVPPAAGLIKLDAMENPYAWPEWLRNDWLDTLRLAALNRYPDPAAQGLKARLRDVLGVPAAAELMLGNGSDELIQMIIQTVASPGSVIMAPEPTFVMYRQLAVVAGLEFQGVPLRADFSLDVNAMIEAIGIHQPAVLFIAYPNNPTGNLFDRDEIETLLSCAPGLVVLDEAYAPFAQDSFMDMLGCCDNLLVLRTLSKLGLAGVRLGLLAGDPQWLGEIEKTRLPYNISTLDQLTGEFALRHYAVFEEQARLIREQRGELLGRLQQLPGLTVYPSAANFILFRVSPGRGTAVFEGLKAGGVLIKNLVGSAPALAHCLRVTVGTPEENAAFVKALESLL